MQRYAQQRARPNKISFYIRSSDCSTKDFALHFLSNKYESQVISHGSFHCVQCAYQPATKFNSFGLQKDHINMGSSDYFYLNKIKNPFRPIKYSFRKEYNICLTDVLQNLILPRMQILKF